MTTAALAARPDLYRRVRSMAGRAAREAVLYPAILLGRGSPRVAFYPSSTREMASLLRAFNIADALRRELGWAAIVVPRHLSQRQRERVARAFRPDISVVQKCRHALNRAMYFRARSFLLDVDDADFLDAELTEPMAEMAKASAGVICGGRYVRDWAMLHAPRADIVWTGTPIGVGPWPDHADRPRIVTWAQTTPLAYPADLAFVVGILVRVAARTAPFTLRLYGWTGDRDHLSLAPLRAAGVALDLVPTLPYDAFLRSLRDVAVGLSSLAGRSEFNKGKSFGKILGYLDAKVPVVCGRGAENAAFFDEATGVASDDADVWVDAIVGLLDDPARRRAMSEAAHDAFRTRLSTEVAAKAVDALLRVAIADHGTGPR